MELDAVLGLERDVRRHDVDVDREVGAERRIDDLLRLLPDVAGVAVDGQMPTDIGRFASALSTAICLPDASATGTFSMPSPVVICCGVPPAVGTAQMWRRSMSLVFVQ